MHKKSQGDRNQARHGCSIAGPGVPKTNFILPLFFPALGASQLRLQHCGAKRRKHCPPVVFACCGSFAARLQDCGAGRQQSCPLIAFSCSVNFALREHLSSLVCGIDRCVDKGITLKNDNALEITYSVRIGYVTLVL